MKKTTGYKLIRKLDKGVFEKIVFVSSAVSKDESRPALLNVLIVNVNGKKNQRVIATDGKRLHSAVLYGLLFAPGMYEVTKTKYIIRMERYEKEGVVFPPNWEYVIPKAKTFEQLFNSNISDSDEIEKMFFKLGKLNKGRCALRYFKDMIKMPGKFANVLTVKDDEHPIVKIESGECFAIVMPIRD
jgi:hypothetical protein